MQRSRIVRLGHPFFNLDKQPLGAFFIVFAHKRGYLSACLRAARRQACNAQAGTHFCVPLHAAPDKEFTGFFRIIRLLEVLVFFLTKVHNASSWASLR